MGDTGGKRGMRSEIGERGWRECERGERRGKGRRDRMEGE